MSATHHVFEVGRGVVLRSPRPAACIEPHAGGSPDNPGPHSVLACVDAELDLRRLAHIHHWLWIAGRPMPPRPLHHQRLLNREIVMKMMMNNRSEEKEDDEFSI
ncbi:uncharacterized protein J7T54_000564 [Emericellopsis cladophorae]|uniref:Uncharacterized protein n=1 Tax=Emericellopsis cladophorae TaxID=2686198 RepID=A0A9P9XTZ6_9HYPO|nr:uncharacterized protein J7T54_000564 [Emericellopsis cladophorae]KAI6777759.1 hypothetical protein J7T54_000564 [Emericellopsis cladophorae]